MKKTQDAAKDAVSAGEKELDKAKDRVKEADSKLSKEERDANIEKRKQEKA